MNKIVKVCNYFTVFYAVKSLESRAGQVQVKNNLIWRQKLSPRDNRT